MTAYDFKAGAQPKMERVSKQNLGPHAKEFHRRHTLNRAIGSNWHEGRGIDTPMRKRKHAASRLAIAMREYKLHGAFSISIASP